MLASLAQIAVFIALSQAPTLTGVSPSSGTVSGGRVVTLTGTRFVEGAIVAFGGITATSVFNGPTSITATTPAAGAPGPVDVTVTNPDTQVATRPNGYNYTLLTIAGISPDVGAVQGGTPFTLTLTGIDPDCTGCLIFFDNSIATNMRVIDASTIRAVTPAHDAGTVTLSLQPPTSTVPDNIAGGFSYHFPPSPTALDVLSGPTSGGTQVTLTGSHFASGATVAFGGTSATGVMFLSSTQLRAVAPPHESGTVAVAVTNPDRLEGTLLSAFTYGSAPRLDSVDPSTGAVAGGTSVTLRGVNFRAGAAIQFGGTPCAVASVLDENNIAAISPEHTAGAVDVTVVNPDGQSSTLQGAFNYGGTPPFLVALAPGSGPIAGGTQVTLSGGNFSSGARVTIGGGSATNVSVGTSTITAATPAHAPGLVDAVVTNSDGQSATLAEAFTYRSDVAQPMDDYVDPATIRPKGCNAAGSTPSILALATAALALIRRRRTRQLPRPKRDNPVGSVGKILGLGSWLTGALVFTSACSDISTRRETPQRPSLGVQLYGVLCDRLGAQSLREDLSASSYRLLCHRKDGLFADKVDTRFLPAVQGDRQRQSRAHGIAQIEALARRRTDLIAALDAMLPDIPVLAKDLKNPDPARSCSPAGQERLRDQLSDLLNRLQAQNLYLDGTLPSSTQSMGRVFTALKDDADLQSALARLDARNGYHPPEITLGTIQTIFAYPRLRDLTNSTLSLISPDSKPYDLRAPTDSMGARIPIPGTAYPQLKKLIEIGHHELRTATADPPVLPLAINRDPTLDRDVLNRSRSAAEMLAQLLLVEDPQLGSGNPRYIVLRDQRGVAKVKLDSDGNIPAPFVDQDGDKLADIDDLGRFVTRNGAPAPTPFPSPAGSSATSRDRFGRALSSTAGLVYEYVDTNHTFIAALLDDLKPLVNPEVSQQHETLMDSLGGLQPLFGERTPDNQPSVKSYPADAREGAATVSYKGFKPESSVLLDLAYAGGQMLGDPTIDETLALSRKLFAEHPNDMARLVGALLKAKEIANRHPESTLSSRSTFWDELIDVAIKIVQAPAVPGHPPLLEDLLTALAADDARPFKDVLAMQMSHKDLVSYDRLNLNATPMSYRAGPGWDIDLDSGRTFTAWFIPVDRTQPDTGSNRSFFQRYLQLIHDSNGVTACNAEGGRLFLRNICQVGFGCFNLEYPSVPNPPAPQPGASECELYRIKNLAKFYLDSIVGEALIFLRPRIGVRGFQSPDTFVDSTGISGLWPTPRGEFLRPKPEFLNRLVFFDFADSPNPGDLNYRSSCFISALNGPYHENGDGTFLRPLSVDHQCIQQQPPAILPQDDFRGGNATVLCQERTIDDPYHICPGPQCRCPGPFCPEDSDPPDYKIHKLGNCKNGQWLNQRDNNVLFAFEQPIEFPDGTTSSTYRALRPVVSAFVSHGQQELFLSLIEVLHRHWQDEHGTICHTNCVSEECNPSAAVTDPFYCSQDGLVRSEPMLAEIFGQTTDNVLDALNNLNKVLINTTIQHCNAVDPVTRLCTSSTPINGITVMANAARALLDPNRSIGLTDRQGNRTTRWNDGSRTVPITPLYLLTNALRAADEVFDQAPDRKALWRRARSQLVDQFFGVDVAGMTFKFARPGLPKVAITGIDSIRAQLLAKCPDTFTPPYTARCAWARDEIYSNLKDTLSGPLFASAQDLTEALRQDTNARVETERLLDYLFGAGVNDSSRAALLASLSDVVQLAGDQTDFIPILHALAPAVSLSTTDPAGTRTAGLLDAQLTLLTRAAGKAFNTNNVELCANEVDPNQVITEVLRRATIPVSIGGTVPQTPLEIYLDVIADVNRAAPDHTDKLKPEDYRSIFDQVADFMLSPEHGLEQFYEIVRQGTVRR